MYYSRLIPIFSFIIFGIVSRFVPHLPNFTAINAIALMGAYSLGSPWLSLLTVCAIMVPTDLVFGFHDCIPFVYLSYGLVILLGRGIASKNSFSRNILMMAISSLLFFLITNFGDWMMGSLYPKTFAGLGLCYVAGLPFLLNQLLGDLFFGAIILGVLSQERLLTLWHRNRA